MGSKRVGTTKIANLQKHLASPKQESDKLVSWFTESMGQYLHERQVKQDPLLLILAEDVLAHCVLVRMANELMFPEKDPKNKKDPSEEAGKSSRETSLQSTQVECILKFRERLRKSVGDLQAAINFGSASIGSGIAEALSEVNHAMESAMAAAIASGRINGGGPLSGLRPDMQAISPLPPAAACQDVEPDPAAPAEDEA